jgi:DsbC/DsbD-like thiol-disulfide interchange protein
MWAMNMHLKVSWKQTAAVALLLAAVAGSAPAFAQGREQKSDFSSLRLLNAGMEGGQWKAGIEISMKPGWKTYWRVPGESGVPPQFDWKQSGNAQDVQVEMPVPKRFKDNNGEGIGYQGVVVFPVSVTPEDSGKPVQLSLQAFYAVCNDICVPVQAEVSLDLSAATASASDRYTLGLIAGEMPQEGSASDLSVKLLKLVEAEGRPALEVAIAGLAAPTKTDIFVETNTTAYFRKPELVSTAGTTAVYRLTVDGLPAGTSLQGKPVRLTIAAGETSLVHDGFVQ